MPDSNIPSTDDAQLMPCGKWFWTEAYARRTVGGAAPTFRHWRERSGLSAPATDPIPALTGTHDQLRQAERLRSGHIATLLDMDRNNTATDAVGSAVAKLLHIAMRQQQAAGGSDMRQGDKPAICWRSWQGGWLRMAGWMPRR